MGPPAGRVGPRAAGRPVEEDAGHGAGKPVTRVVDEQADVWASLARQPGPGSRRDPALGPRARGRRPADGLGEGAGVYVSLFTYGTLMRRRRLEALVGERLADPRPAVLRGYRKYDTGRGYPIILPDPSASVHGLVYAVPVTALPDIDHYEGTDEDPPHYFRETATAEVEGREEAVQVYVGNPEVYRDLRPLEPDEPPRRPPLPD